MSLIDIGIYAGYILIAVCAIAAIFMPLIQSFSDPKSLAKSGIGLAVLVVVFVVGYAMSDGSAAGTTESTSKLVGAGLISTYIFFGAAIVGIVYTEIAKLIK